MCAYTHSILRCSTLVGSAYRSCDLGEKVLVAFKDSQLGFASQQASLWQSGHSMSNTTWPQESDKPLDSLGFMAYSILVTVLTLVAGALLVFTLMALTRANPIARVLRIFLINLLLAGLMAATAVALTATTSAVLVAADTDQPRPPQYLCRAYMWMFGAGAVARLWNLAAFSISVLAIVRFGKGSINWYAAAVIIAILWIVPIAITLYTLLPRLFAAHFVHGVGCFPNNNSTDIIPQARYVFLAAWVTVGGLTPLTISITVPIVCLCYIRQRVVKEEAQHRKAMAKFSLFLVLGSAINIAGQLVPGLIPFYSETAAVYLCYGIAAVSLFPTPIIIIAYLKPVQQQAKKMISCGRFPNEAKDSKWTTSIPKTSVAEGRV